MVELDAAGNHIEGKSCGFEEASDDARCMARGSYVASRYLIGRCLGVGGFGVTYLTWDTTLRRVVAIKEYLPIDIARRDTQTGNVVPLDANQDAVFRQGRERFLEEARTIAHFQHLNIVDVLDWFSANNTAYICMKYYPGESLGRVVAKSGGTIPWQSAVDLSIGILDAVREVHRAGLLHRDIKPDNILVTAELMPVLLDFGAARSYLSRQRRHTVMYTPGMSAPEQVLGGQQDVRTDIYSTAATLYFMLAGRSPEFDEDGAVVIPEVLATSIPRQLAEALRHALQMDIARRPESVDQWRQEIEAASSLRSSDTPQAASSQSVAALATPSWSARRRFLTRVGWAFVLPVGALATFYLWPGAAGQRKAQVMQMQRGEILSRERPSGGNPVKAGVAPTQNAAGRHASATHTASATPTEMPTRRARKTATRRRRRQVLSGDPWAQVGVHPLTPEAR